MGCAIGMSLLAAIEIFYWFLFKPFFEIMTNQYPSPNARRFSRLLCLSCFVATLLYAGYRFTLVHQFASTIEEELDHIFKEH